MRRAIVIGAAVLALSACGKKEEAAKTGEEQAAVATAPAPPAMRKAGLWTQTVSAEGATQTMKLCLDAAAAEDIQFNNAPGTSNCSKNTITPIPGGMKFESVCQAGAAGTVTSTGTATGDFASAYKVEVTSTTTGASIAQANGTHKATIDARWEGACPAGMKPGDIQLPGGMTINPAAMAEKMGAMQGK